MFLPFASAFRVLAHVDGQALWCQLRVITPALLLFSHAQIVYKPNIKLSVSTWDKLLCCVHSAMTHTMA